MEIDILEKLKEAKTKEEREWLAMQFNMKDIKSELREAVWAASILHWFDGTFLNALMDKPLKESDFQAFTNLSFIEKFPGRGWNVHERSRELLRDKLWEKNKERYRELSNKAYIYCNRQDQQEILQRIETLYHGLIAGNTNIESKFVSQLYDWRNKFEYERMEALVIPVLQAVKKGRISGLPSAWTYYYQAKIDYRYSRFNDAKKNLNNALQQVPESNDSIVPNCHETFGDINQIMAKYGEARQQYEFALSIFEKIKDPIGQINCIKSLGDVHRMLEENDKARKQYEKSLDIYKNINDTPGEIQSLKANCIKALGDLHKNLDEFREAQKLYDDALIIYREIKERHGEAICIRALGEVYTNIAQYDAASERFDEALAIYNDIGFPLEKNHCLLALGELYGEIGEEKKAINTLTETSEKYKKLDLPMHEANCFNSIGDFYFNTQKYNDAINYYSEAIKIAPEAAWWYLNRAAARMRIDNYEAAAEDLERTGKYQPKSAQLLMLRGVMNLWQKNIDTATSFLNKSISLRPENGECHFYFALTLIVDEQREKAYKELDKAINNTYKKRQLIDFQNELNKLKFIYGSRHDLGKMYDRLNAKLELKS